MYGGNSAIIQKRGKSHIPGGIHARRNMFFTYQATYTHKFLQYLSGEKKKSLPLHSLVKNFSNIRLY